MIIRVPCDSCGAEILPVTAEATGGICMACKQGIRRGPFVRTLETASAPLKETVIADPNGHIHISGDDGSYTHINVSRVRMSAGDSFLHQLQNVAEVRKKVTNLILNGKAADLEKGDLEPLMRLWIKGVEAERSGDISTQFFLGSKFADEFENLSRILTAAGFDLDKFAIAAFEPAAAPSRVCADRSTEMNYMTSTINRGRAVFVSLCCVMIAMIVAYVGPPENISGVDVSSPLIFRVGIASFFGLFAVWILVSMHPSLQRPYWVVPAIVICWSLSGFAGCQSTVHRTSASVSVNTSWGGYNRRPPGMKQYDDRQDRKTFWFRALIFSAWVGAVFLRFSLEDENTQRTKAEQVAPSNGG